MSLAEAFFVTLSGPESDLSVSHADNGQTNVLTDRRERPSRAVWLHVASQVYCFIYLQILGLTM